MTDDPQHPLIQLMYRLLLSLVFGLLMSQALALPAENTQENAMASPSYPDNEKHFSSSIDFARQTLTERANNLVLNAMGFLGVPYRRGGSSAESGFDCSGFVRNLYEQTVGHVLPRRAKDQAAVTDVIDKKDLKPGDLVFFNTMKKAFSHVGIYIGDGKFIHAPRAGSEVRVEDMRQAYWEKRFNGARRVNAKSNSPDSEITATRRSQ